MPVLPRWRHEIGEPVEKTKRRELDAAARAGPRGLSAAAGPDPVGLKVLVGHVVIEKRKVEGHAEPQMVARSTLSAVPALAVLDRGRVVDHDGSNVSAWGSLHDDRETPPEGSLNQGEVSVPLLRTLPRKR
jgi:hypothetical protein